MAAGTAFPGLWGPLCGRTRVLVPSPQPGGPGRRRGAVPGQGLAGGAARGGLGDAARRLALARPLRPPRSRSVGRGLELCLLVGRPLSRPCSALTLSWLRLVGCLRRGPF